ncbi:MAG: ribonuclease P protein component [Patescibacteria group bacterium]
MLPEANRLKHDRDFTTLFKEGMFAGSSLVTVKFWKINPARYPRRNYQTHDLRIGFVVSTKVSKNAVVRNRLKRQMREIVRLLLQKGQLKTGYLLAIMAKAEMIGKEYKEIEADILSVLRRAGLLKNSND